MGQSYDYCQRQYDAMLPPGWEDDDEEEYEEEECDDAEESI